MADVLDQIREYMEAAIGKLSPAKAQDLAKSLTKGQGRDQVTKTAKDPATRAAADLLAILGQRVLLETALALSLGGIHRLPKGLVV